MLFAVHARKMPWQAGSRVLVIDSDLEVRLRLSSRLLESDIFSDSAANAAEALKALEETRYALVILDLGIANDGDGLLARLAGMPLGERPIVIATGTKDAARNISADVVQIVLRRPLSVVAVTDLIRSCLRPLGPSDPLQALAKNGDQPTS